MSKRGYVNLRIQINNDCTPEPPSKRQKCTSPDEGCFSASRDEDQRKTSVPFDKDVDSLLCLQDRGDDGYFSLSFETQDAARQGPEELKLGPPLFESSVCGEEESINNSIQLSKLFDCIALLIGNMSLCKTCFKWPSRLTDVMGELLSLMSEVAQDSRDPQWQHPSDLTRRNYEKRFKPTPVTLQEYEDKLDFTYKRFASVPKVFKRSK
uniref:S100P-binding protein n=1 Tax=Neogobius melanostomus TaxID=47308 RepID=A0A8C6TWS1_9GOBI